MVTLVPPSVDPICGATLEMLGGFRGVAIAETDKPSMTKRRMLFGFFIKKDAFQDRGSVAHGSAASARGAMTLVWVRQQFQRVERTTARRTEI